MHSFRNWLTEEHDSSTPHHIYQTKSGHEIHVHLHKDENGNSAHFHNQSMGGQVVKKVNWRAGTTEPTKAELEKMSADDEEDDSTGHIHETRIYGFSELITEAKLTPEEKAAKAAAAEKAKAEKAKLSNVKDGKLSNNGGGIVAEMATHYWLNEHKHKMAGTHGSKEHLAEQKDIKDRIDSISEHPSANTKAKKDALKKEIQLRIYHGRQAASDIIREVRDLHGPKARVTNVGWTSKPGDIPRFTRGQHNDGQENTSDVAVEVAGSKHPSKNSDGTHFEGFSLKSSLQKAEITAKNPGADMDGMLNHPTRQFNADTIGRQALAKHAHAPLGLKNMTPKERGEALEKARAEHKAAGGKKGESPFELKANEGGKKAIRAQNDELHEHINHLGKQGKDGNSLVGKMVVSHLFPDTDMRNHKVKVFGDSPDKVRSVTEPNSDHPLKKFLKDPKAQFHATKNADGGAVHVHVTHPKLNGGKPLHIYTASAKPKSNASKESTMGWNVKAATMK